MQTRHPLAVAIAGLAVSGLAACGGTTFSEPTLCASNAECAAGFYCASGGACVADAAGPAIAIASPTAGASVSAAAVSLEGTVSDAGAGVGSASWSSDGTTFQDLALTAGAFAQTVPLPSADGAVVVLTVRAVDKVGNVSTRTVTFTADSQPPAVAVTAPAADGSCAGSCTGAVATLAHSSFALSGAVADGGGLAAAGALVAQVLDGGTVVVPATPVATSEGAWSYTWSSLPLANGKVYTFRITATDAAGNSASAERAIYVDRVVPALAIGDPAASSILATATAAVNGAADDGTGSGLASVEVSVDGVAFAPAGRAGGQYSATVSLPDTDRAAFTITVRVTDVAGNQASATRLVFVDRRPPVLAITSPAVDGSCSGTACAGAVINAATVLPFVFSGTALDAGGLRAGDGLVATVLQGGVVVSGPTPLTPSNGTWSFPWAAPSAGGTSYTLRLVATDPGGNSTTASRVVYVDRVAPALAIATPAAASTLATASAAVGGTADDGGGSGVAAVEVSTDGAVFAPVSWASGQFAATVSLPQTDRAPFSITVRATDVAGNRATAVRSVFVDRQAPALAITSPAVDGNCPGTGCTGAVINVDTPLPYVFSGTTGDAAGLRAGDGLVATVVQGGVVVTGPTALTSSAGAWSFPWTALAVGGTFYTFNLVATDPSGNSTTASRIVFVDRQQPTVSIASPVAGHVAATPTLSVTGALHDEYAVASVTASTDGATFIPLTATGNQYTGSIPVPDVDRSSLTLTVRVADTAGNRATATVPIFADRRGPAVAIVDPALDFSCAPSCGGAVVHEHDGTYSFTGTASDPGGLAASSPIVGRVYRGGALVTTVTASGSPWTMTWSGCPIVNGAEYVFEVVATDSAGNSSAAARRVWVDRVTPTVSFTRPTPGQLIGTSTVNVAGSVSDPLASTEMSLDGVHFWPLTQGGTSLDTNLDVPTGDRQPVIIYVRATDPAGNQSTSSVQYFADRQAPAIAITTPAQDASCAPLGSCSGGVVRAGDDTYAFAGTTTDPSGFAAPGGIAARIYHRDVLVHGPVALSGGFWTVPWSAPAYDNGVEYVFEVVATDAAGNQAAASRHVWVDRVAPTFTFTSPSPGQLVGNTDTLQVSGTVSNEYGVAALLSTDGVNFHPATMSDVQFNGNVGVPEGDRQSVTITARIEDAVGNVGTGTVQYWADRQGPALVITAPGADYSCPAMGPCTGAKVLAADTSYTFSGTAADPSGFDTHNVAGGMVAWVTTGEGVSLGNQQYPSANPAWTFTWSNLPTVNGAEYVFNVLADDAAGNRTMTSRRVWVDRAPPTVTMNKVGERLVLRTSGLATFSEVMDVGSVQAATAFTPSAASMATFGSADGRNFSFASTSGLDYYTTYTMEIGTAAMDRAGNPMASPAGQMFLSERAPLEAGMALVVAPGADSPASPRLAIDSDGKPLLVYGAGTSGYMRSAGWDGRGSAFPGEPLWPGWPTDLELTGSSIDPASLALSTARALAGMYDGTDPMFAIYESATWLATNWNVATTSTFGPMLAHYPGCMKPPAQCASNERAALVILSHYSPREEFRGHLNTWAGWEFRFWHLGYALAQQGPAVFTANPPDDPGTLRYYDHDGPSPNSIANPAATQVSGRAQLWLDDCQDPGGVWLACRSGSAWLASNQDGVLIDPPPSSGVETRLGVACNSAPLDAASPWKVSWARLDELHPPQGSPDTTGSVTAIRTALTAARFAAAVALTRGSESFVKVVTAPNGDTDCIAAPELTVSPTVINDARDPGITVDADGSIWVAYVVASSGDLMVMRLP